MTDWCSKVTLGDVVDHCGRTLALKEDTLTPTLDQNRVKLFFSSYHTLVGATQKARLLLLLVAIKYLLCTPDDVMMYN